MWNDNMKRMADILEGECRMVGGAVRDTLLGAPVNDYDFCTPLKPDEIIERFRHFDDISIIETGIQHGTVTIRFPNSNEQFELTTLRFDQETDGRHANVKFGASWKEDAARRDFTFNAMMMDVDGTLYDYFDGQSDLYKGRVKFIGNANDRIKEDYLRIMRWFRFYGRFGDCNIVDFETLAPIKSNAYMLMSISKERIWTEMQKILMNVNISYILNLMSLSDVLKNAELLGRDEFEWI